MKRVVFVLVLLALAGGGLWVWQSHKKQVKARPFAAKEPQSVAQTPPSKPEPQPVPKPVRSTPKVYAHFMGCWPAAAGALPHYMREEAKITGSEHFARAAKDPCGAVGGRIVNWPLLPEGYTTNALEDAKLEISRAIRAGIDGFAFDAWAGGDSARQLLDAFFQAAEEMKVDFGLTICFDPSCHPHGPNDGTMIEQFITTAKYVLKHIDSPNLARFDGKPLFFGYHSEGIVPREKRGENEWASVAAAWEAWRKALPCPVFLHGSIDSFACIKDPSPEQMKALGEWAGKTFDAVGGFLGTDHNWGMNTNLAAGVRSVDGEWSQPLFFQYCNKRGGIITDAGLNHLRANWDAANRNGSRLLQFVTWNDYGEETSMGPAFGTSYTLTRVNRHFIEKWKTGREPKIEKDEVHAVFRRAVSIDDVYPFLSRRVPRPTVLEIDLFLTEPAQVAVAGYGKFEAPAGYSFKQFPLKAGAIQVKVARAGKVALNWKCPEEVAQNAWREDMTLAAYGTNYEEEWKADFPDEPLFFYTENADNDGDGLPNWWEMIYFGNFPLMSTATAADAKADPDGDGRTNLQEYRDKTNPLVKDKAGYGVGYTWRLSDLKDDTFVANPFKDRKGRSRWFVAYKFGEPRKITHDGDYTMIDWGGDSARRRGTGVYAKNPWGYGGDCTVSTNGTVALGPRPECLMLLGWKAPRKGVYTFAATVTGGKGASSSIHLSFEKGTEQLATVSVKQDETAELSAAKVPLKKDEMLWFIADARDSWGMRGVTLEKLEVKRVK